MDIYVNDFDTDILLCRNNCLVIGNPTSGRSTIIKDIITTIKPKFFYGVIFTDKIHMNGFYNFFNPLWLYKRYSPLLYNRCFMDNMFIILDSYHYTKDNYLTVINNCNSKNILLIMTSNNLINITELDYIFLCRFIEYSTILEIYEKYIKNHIDLYSFNELFKLYNDNNELLIINCKSTDKNDLFLSYFIDLNLDIPNY